LCGQLLWHRFERPPCEKFQSLSSIGPLSDCSSEVRPWATATATAASPASTAAWASDLPQVKEPTTRTPSHRARRCARLTDIFNRGPRRVLVPAALRHRTPPEPFHGWPSQTEHPAFWLQPSPPRSLTLPETRSYNVIRTCELHAATHTDTLTPNILICNVVGDVTRYLAS